MTVKSKLRLAYVLAAMSILLLAAFTGCATTHGNLAHSADRLQRNAEALGRDAARQLATDTRALRAELAGRGEDDPDVRAAFERVSHDYQVLREDAERSNSREAQVDLQPITEAYLDVEREMRVQDRHHYAREYGYVPREL
jgi:hypothetical protein